MMKSRASEGIFSIHFWITWLPFWSWMHSSTDSLNSETNKRC